MNPLPFPAWLLGAGGVIPFLVLSLMIWFRLDPLLIEPEQLAPWLLAYAAVILSFLGAIHWGAAMGISARLTESESNRLFVYSVVPAILAWIGLLLPLEAGFFVMSGLIVLAYVADAALLFDRLDSDYRKLRIALTLVVAPVLAVTGVLL